MATLDLSPTLMAAVGITFVVGGFIKGVVGLGLPTVSMGLLGLFLPPAQAAVLLLVPSFATNLWQMGRPSQALALLRQLWTLQLGVVFGTLCAPVGLAGLDPRLGALGLGAALLVYALSGLASLRFAVPLRWRPLASPLVGLATGAVTAATGVFVFPAVPYLQGLGMDKERLVQAMGLSFLVSTLALGWRLAGDGAIPSLGRSDVAGAALSLVFALLGMAAGQWLRRRLSEALFRRVFFVGIGAVALHLLLVKGALR